MGHPKYFEILHLLKAGRTDSFIERHLHVGRRAVTKIRQAEGIPPVPKSLTLLQKLEAGLGPADANGHMRWIGVYSHTTPIVKHNGRERSAAAIAFEIRTGRAAVGQTRSECGEVQCMNPLHVADDLERRRVRLMMREMIGLPGHWQVCRAGHSWEEHGRVEPDLTLYCKACTSDRDPRLARNGGTRPRWSR